ncbi:hypothetical protein TYRP_010758 [Tyrophagus putrescentiae]|nr:hypothetical protein TYRP_010758 [Tyrophagus putrescentiae]
MTYFTLGLKPTTCRNEMASKECWANGTWAKIWKSYALANQTRLVQEEYTNYFRCSTPGATHKLRFIRTSIGVYFVSLVLTIVGLLLITRYGTKKQPTLSYIHINFLISLIFTSVFSLCVSFFIKEKHYLLNSMIDKNPPWCRILLMLQKAARLANYCWMLNEGIILWLMIVLPFRKWANMVKFLLIGWGLPVVVMTAYTVVHLNPKFNNSCWTKSMGYWELLYNIPPISFILINIVLLVNMTYIMFKKLSSSNDTHIKSGLRASLFLVPVFGIQYVFYIVPFDPFESCATYLFVIHYVLIITEALQGAMVATIFCFFNKEIQENIQKQFKKKRYFRYGDSVHHTERHELSGAKRSRKLHSQTSTTSCSPST